jgi:hypothetical protein
MLIKDKKTRINLILFKFYVNVVNASKDKSFMFDNLIVELTNNERYYGNLYLFAVERRPCNMCCSFHNTITYYIEEI